MGTTPPVLSGSPAASAEASFAFEKQVDTERLEKARLLGLPANLPPEAEAMGTPQLVIAPSGYGCSIFAVLLGLWLGIAGVINAINSKGTPEGIVLMTVVGSSLVVFPILREVRRSRIRTIVYPTGFVVLSWGKPSVWHWSDIVSVTSSRRDLRILVHGTEVAQQLQFRWNLVRRDGARWTIQNSQGKRAGQLGGMVEDETLKVMLPATIAQMKAGGAVEFRPFRVDANGLWYGKAHVPWPEVGQAVIQGGRLKIYWPRMGTTIAEVPLPSITNAHVFLALLWKVFNKR
jgi:hypothetical protein